MLIFKSPRIGGQVLMISAKTVVAKANGIKNVTLTMMGRCKKDSLEDKLSEGLYRYL